MVVYTNDGANCRSRTGLSDNVYIVVVGEVDRVWRGRQVGIGYPNWVPKLGTQIGVQSQNWVPNWVFWEPNRGSEVAENVDRELSFTTKCKSLS
jgi:hypothetical protein